MIAVRVTGLRRGGLVAWLGSLTLGAAVGGIVVAGHRFGLWLPLGGAAREIALSLSQRVGPVWIPMLLVALRVGWLALVALRTRFGWGTPGAPVRPELGQLAPLFAALGLCGTVWGLSAAFDALGGGGFLEHLPSLLGGLGAAMTSTLAGLSLQIATLLLAAFNPTWSHAHVGWGAEGLVLMLDRRPLGVGSGGLEALVVALGARQPEALRVSFDPRVPFEQRRHVHEILWRRTDSAIPLREAQA